MNDSQEHFWLRSKALSFTKSQDHLHPDRDGYKYLTTLLRQSWRHEIYCACLSEHPDSLSQWRAYGEDGKGFAIGFSTTHLQSICKNIGGTLCDVIYDDDVQSTLVKRAFDLPPRSSDGEDPTIEEGSGTILGRISEAASRSKNRAFSEESEWRIVTEPTLALDDAEQTLWTKATVPRYVARRGLITPYMEIPLVEGESYRKRGMEPIKELYFGPKNSADEQEYAVKFLLENHGFKRVQLVHSSASYR